MADLFGGIGGLESLASTDPQIQDAIIRQMYAQTLAKGSMDAGPVASPWQAAARAAQGIVGGWEQRQASQAMQDYAKNQQAQMDALDQERQRRMGGGGMPGAAPGMTPGSPTAAQPGAQPGGGGGGGGPGGPTAPPTSLAPGGAGQPGAAAPGAPGAAPGAAAPGAPPPPPGAPSDWYSRPAQERFQFLWDQADAYQRIRNPIAQQRAASLRQLAQEQLKINSVSPPVVTGPGNETSQTDLSGRTTVNRPATSVEQQEQAALQEVQKAQAAGGDYSKLSDATRTNYQSWLQRNGYKPTTTALEDGGVRTVWPTLPKNMPDPGLLYGGGAAAPGGAGAPGSSTTTTGSSPAEIATRKEAVQQQIQSDEKRVAGEEQAADATRGVTGVTQSIRDLMGNVSTGWTAELRTKAGGILQTLGADKDKIQGFLGIDPGSGQALQKRFLELVSDRVKQMGGREGAQVLQTFQNAYPNLEMTPQALKMMMGVIDMDQHYREERAAGLRDYHTQARDNLGPDMKGYKGLGGFGASWDATHDPKVYMATGLASSGAPYEMWAKDLTKEQRQQVGGLVSRYYPGGSFYDSQGRLRSAGG